MTADADPLPLLAEHLRTLGVRLIDWPYSDLPMLQPTCPGCGRGRLLVGPNLHPTGWCDTDSCDVLRWAPERPALEQLRDGRHVVEHVDDAGRVTWSAEHDDGPASSTS